MASVNQINLTGYCGRDCEMNYTPSGKAVARFSLAVNDYAGKDKDGNVKYNTMWVSVILWNSLAESMSSIIVKGSQYFVTGKLSIREYTDKQGNQRTAIEVIANQVTPLTPKSQRTATTEDTNDDWAQHLDNTPF
jgi:single-strand DNA-binding protein